MIMSSFYKSHGSELSSEDRTGLEDGDFDDPNREETGSMPPSEPNESPPPMTCVRTGLAFQSSKVMKLLSMYDDGVCPPVAHAPFPTESVFCRICREGLHDDADDQQPAAAKDEAEAPPEDSQDPDEPLAVDPVGSMAVSSKGPVSPHPPYTTNNEAIQNPILAPCECSGSMAFVHRLCVEQWRCRSRHPAAKEGLNCETCGSAYALPAPEARQAPGIEQEDEWMNAAMPAHVVHALRQPHIWWHISAVVVRRRWLRPLAPVLMSPVVALYCRARRMLKKRGVARRRWACSLCRRRARWKCVRCLRSYYCSRQCQNVSWHIVHKHVCYKPARFYWSVVVYSILALLLFPGILRDPMMYDVGLFAVPVSFIVTGVLGGSVATLLKKASGIDARGRLLELSVVIATIILTDITWGVIRGYFGNPTACYGAFGPYAITSHDLETTTSTIKVLQWIVLKPAKMFYSGLDRTFARLSWIRKYVCFQESEEKCFEHLPNVNENFFLQEEEGEKCAADLVLLLSLYQIALISFVFSSLAKQQERRQRRHRPRRRPVHAHED